MAEVYKETTQRLNPFDNNHVEAEEGGSEEEEEEFYTLKNGKRAQIVSGMDGPLKHKPLGEQTRAVRRQELMVILANFGLLSGGIGIAMPTVTLNELRDPHESLYLTQAQASWFASLNTLTCPLGGLLSGYLLDKFGRKNTLYVLNVVSLIAWMLFATASQTDPDWFYMQLMASRFLTGIGMGLVSAPVGVYSAEISLPKIRGRLILGTSISVALGITMLYSIGYFIRNDFRLIALICCGYQLVSLLCVVPLVESPSWLLSKGRVDEAKMSLNYFRGLEKQVDIIHPEVLTEFNMLQKSLELKEGQKRPSFLSHLRLPEVYRPLLILMGLFAFQQLTGIFVIIVYAVQIAIEANVSIDPFMCAVLIGVARVLTTCPMGIVLEKWGRRRAGIISAIGMCVCMFLLAGHSWFPLLQRIPYLPVLAIVAFIIFSTLGLYTLPFFMISELFPQKVRGPASGLTVAVGMFFAFVCIKIYPDLKNAIGNEYCFVLYGIMSFMAAIFVYVALPETRGRTLLEIEEQFRQKAGIRKTVTEVEMQKTFIPDR